MTRTAPLGSSLNRSDRHMEGSNRALSASLGL
jgi:hypothetical protein